MTNIHISISFLLFVLLPLFHSENTTDTDHYFIYYGNHQIPCENGNADMNVNWYKDSEEISILALTDVTVDNDGSLHFSNFIFAHAGHYICENASSGFNLFIDCGPFALESTVSLVSICECNSGYYRNISASYYTCTLCPLSTYKPHPGNHDCFSCPMSRVTLSTGSTDDADCICISGYGTIDLMDLCVPCPADYYQPNSAYTACVSCPLYSATPQAMGEVDAEGFTMQSDCICQYTQGNADNSTCYAYATSPVVSIIDITQTSFVVSFERQEFARAEDGSLRGNIDRYLVEVSISTTSSLFQFERIDNLTGLTTINVEINGLESGNVYKIVVTSFVLDMKGEPSVVEITSALPTTTTPITTKTPTTITKPITTSTDITITKIIVFSTAISNLPSNGMLLLIIYSQFYYIGIIALILVLFPF